MTKPIKPFQFTKWELKEFLNACNYEEVLEMLNYSIGKRQVVEMILKIYDTHNVHTNTKIERFFWKKLGEKK